MDSRFIVSDTVGLSDAAPFFEPRDRRATLGSVGGDDVACIATSAIAWAGDHA